MEQYAWLLGFRSVIQHARRNLATALTLGFGYMALVLVFGYGTRVSNYFSTSTIFLQQSGHVTAFKKDGLRQRLVRPSKYSLDPEDIAALEAALKARPDFDFSAPYMIGSGLIGNGCRSYLFSGQGLVPEMEKRIRNHPEVLRVAGEVSIVEKGQELWANAAKNQVSMGADLARKLGKNQIGIGFGAGDKTLIDCNSKPSPADFSRDSSVQLLSRDYSKRISAAEADISSLFRTGVAGVDEGYVQMPLGLMQELFATDKVSYLSIFLKDEKKSPEVAAYLSEAMEKAGRPIDAFVWNDVRLNPNYVNGVGLLNFSLLFVSIIVMVVVLLSILNTLTIGLAESRREIGTLRAIGYKPGQVASIFAVEAMVVCSGALIIAAGLAKIFVSLIAAKHIPFRLPGLTYATTFQITPTLENFVQCALPLLGLVFITTILKTRSYAKQSVLALLDPGG